MISRLKVNSRLSTYINLITPCLRQEEEPRMRYDINDIRISIYFLDILHADVDFAGHSFGPGSPQLKEAIKDTDLLLSSMFEYLDNNQLSDVDIIVVSDHGMANVSETNIIDISHVIDMNDIDELLEGGSVTQIWPKPGREMKVNTFISSKSKGMRLKDINNIF